MFFKCLEISLLSARPSLYRAGELFAKAEIYSKYPSLFYGNYRENIVQLCAEDWISYNVYVYQVF
jgi:hypothetical protein